MTINELLAQGISFQGDKITVVVYDIDEDKEVFRCPLYSIRPDNPARDKYTVSYIYPGGDDEIIVEVRKED